MRKALVLCTLANLFAITSASAASAGVSALCDSIHKLDCNGDDLPDGHITGTWSHADCCSACESRAGCNAWTWLTKTGDCYLKSACTDKRTDDDSKHSGIGPSPSPTPPAPSPSPPSPSPAPGNWIVGKGKNCYPPSNGAQDHMCCPDSAYTSKTLEECKISCAATVFCDGVTYQASSSRCYLRHAIELSSCTASSGWDSYVKPVGPNPTEWIEQIEKGHGGTFLLKPGTYYIDRQYQLPTNTQIIGSGSGDGGTLIVASGAPYDDICNEAAKNRKGFLLGDNSYIGHLRFKGMDQLRFCNNQLLCGGAPFETPGCATTGDWGEAPDSCIHTGIGHGVRNATLDDIVVEAMTVQNVVYIAPTPKGAPVSQDITIRKVITNGTWADGMNIHGGHKNILVDSCDVRNLGDDAYAIWSVGDSADNITFQNSRAENPWYRAGCQSGTGNYKSNYCFAVYGGKTSAFLNNECYGAKYVVVYGNDQHRTFGGTWDADGSSLVKGVTGDVPNTCYFGVKPPFDVPCTRDASVTGPGVVV